MSQVYCAECGKSYSKSEVFDIKIWKDVVYWCFNCAAKQLKYSDYILIHKDDDVTLLGRSAYVKSVEDDVLEYQNIIRDLLFCFKKDFGREAKNEEWVQICELAQEIQNE